MLVFWLIVLLGLLLLVMRQISPVRKRERRYAQLAQWLPCCRVEAGEDIVPEPNYKEILGLLRSFPLSEDQESICRALENTCESKYIGACIRYVQAGGKSSLRVLPSLNEAQLRRVPRLDGVDLNQIVAEGLDARLRRLSDDFESQANSLMEIARARPRVAGVIKESRILHLRRTLDYLEQCVIPRPPDPPAEVSEGRLSLDGLPTAHMSSSDVDPSA